MHWGKLLAPYLARDCHEDLVIANIADNTSAGTLVALQQGCQGTQDLLRQLEPLRAIVLKVQKIHDLHKNIRRPAHACSTLGALAIDIQRFTADTYVPTNLQMHAKNMVSMIESGVDNGTVKLKGSTHMLGHNH